MLQRELLHGLTKFFCRQPLSIKVGPCWFYLGTLQGLLHFGDILDMDQALPVSKK